MSKIYGSHYQANSKNKAKDRRATRNFRKGKYQSRWSITERNRLKKRLKHMVKQPNDLQTKKLLNNE